MAKNRSTDWLKQAEDDLSWARSTLAANHFSQACFICQQIGEKSIKAVAFSRGVSLVKSHSIMEIAKSLGINGDIENIGKRLDLYYISARYPDAFSSGAPYEYFTREQAEEAIRFAERLLVEAKKQIHGTQ